MAENEPKISAEDLTDAQITEEIRYLDTERRDIGRNENDDIVLAICASLLIIALGIVGYVLFCLRIS
jgi:hypothetical protein